MHSRQLIIMMKHLLLTLTLLCLGAALTLNLSSVSAMGEINASQTGEVASLPTLPRVTMLYVDSASGISILYPETWVQPEMQMGSIFFRSANGVTLGSAVPPGEALVSLTIVPEEGLLDLLDADSIADGIPHFLTLVRIQAPFNDITCGATAEVGAFTSVFCLNDNHAGSIIATAYSMMLFDPGYAVIAQTNAAPGELENQILYTYAILNSMGWDGDPAAQTAAALQPTQAN